MVFGPRSVYTSYFTCDWTFCVQDRPGDKAIDLTLAVRPARHPVLFSEWVYVASAFRRT
jgi:hypothetical protein